MSFLKDAVNQLKGQMDNTKPTPANQMAPVPKHKLKSTMDFTPKVIKAVGTEETPDGR